jgi:hypothetical protein
LIFIVRRGVSSRRARAFKNKSHSRPLTSRWLKKGRKALLFDRRIDEFIGTSTDSPVTDPETPFNLEKSLAIFVEWCRDV